MMFGLGVALAFVLIYLKLSPMAVAIGIYLPFTLTLPIMLGGLIQLFTDKFVEKKVMADETNSSEETRKAKLKTATDDTQNKGILFASGLIAGEAVIGVVIAFLVILKVNMQLIGVPAEIPGLLVFIYIGILLAYFLLRDHLRTLNMSEFRGFWRSVFRDYWTYVKNLGKKTG